MSILKSFIATMGVNPVFSLGAITDPVEDVGPPADATITLESDGDIFIGLANSSSGVVGQWITPKALASSAYDARMTVNSGSVTSGTTGSWLSLGSSRSWQQQRLLAGTQTANVTLEVRRNAGGAVLASATFNFTADYP